VRYLLDTNACIALINGTPEPVRTRLGDAVGAGADVAISSIVAFELWYGAAKSGRPDFNSRRIEWFLGGPVELLPFTDEDGRAAGRVRASLESAGTPIGAYDVLIAAQALRIDAVLVTNNTRELTRVRGLVTDDWTRPV
jgi:tRNA(fMet)-specific endonuclease VapC